MVEFEVINSQFFIFLSISEVVINAETAEVRIQTTILEIALSLAVGLSDWSVLFSQVHLKT
jgi:hypothetical protein